MHFTVHLSFLSFVFLFFYLYYFHLISIALQYVVLKWDHLFCCIHTVYTSADVNVIICLYKTEVACFQLKNPFSKHKEIQQVVKETAKKGLNINCKTKECIVACKTNRPTWNILIRSTKSKQVQQFKKLSSVVTKDRKCDRDLWSHIGIATYAIQ